MGITFNFTVSEKEASRALARKISSEEWIELFEENSESYMDWSVDLKIAAHFVKKVKGGYIDNTLSFEQIPSELAPLLDKSISENFKEQNERNKDFTLEQTCGEEEMEAIKVLRNYTVVDYQDAVSLFCDGYDFAKNTLDKELSDYTTEELLNEIKGRL